MENYIVETGREIQEVETELEVIAPSALESIERANIDIQVTTARKYPRRLAIVKQRMMNLATLDEETAASCFYSINRGGKAIQGPSIRLAEIAATSYGNLRFGARVVANDGKNVVAQGFCHDLETNVLSTIEVQRRITDKNGRTYSDDMQTVTGNAACSIAARNAIFKVVPFAFVKPIYLAARQTAVGDITTLAERRTKMLAKFASLGLNDKRICESLDKAGMEEIGLGELETLIGLYNAIRDGDQTVDEAFPAKTAASAGIKFGAAGLEDAEKNGKQPAAAAAEEPDKKKRHRRTKAQIEADKNAEKHSHEKGGGSSGENPESATSDAGREASMASAPAATPLEVLRGQINESPITEEQFRNHLIAKMAIEPHHTLEKLPEEKILILQKEFMAIASEITDKE